MVVQQMTTAWFDLIHASSVQSDAKEWLDMISDLMVHASRFITKMGLVSTSFSLQRARPSAARSFFISSFIRRALTGFGPGHVT
jgi:hypothetical protein